MEQEQENIANSEEQSLHPSNDSTSTQSKFSQIDLYLSSQIERCLAYKAYFKSQGDLAMASKFETLAILSSKDLDLLRKVWTERHDIPTFKFEDVRMNCVPMNCDVKEKEVQVVVKTSNMASSENSMTYVIAEFEFPIPKDERTIGESMVRWLHEIKIDLKKLFCCYAKNDDRQLDIIYSTEEKPFYELDSNMTGFDRALHFYVDKGKSRTLKRKYKPVKLTFFEKTSFVQRDKKLGIVLVKIDSINEEATTNLRLPIMLNRRETGAYADILVKVREPLVEKIIRTHMERILVLT